jgi:hypothetical protein
MTYVPGTPYTIACSPGSLDPWAAGKRAATVVVNRWMPGHAGGVHHIVTPRIAALFQEAFVAATKRGKPIEIRVSIENNLPLLTIL